MVLVLLLAAAGGTSASSTRVFHSVDKRLCPFPLKITVTSATSGTTAAGLWFVGPSTVALENGSTGRKRVLTSPGSYSVDPRTGTISFSGRRLWLPAAKNDVPFLSTSGPGRLVAPLYLLQGGSRGAAVIDPCALVSATPPSPKPAATPAPWGLPRYALTWIGRAGLVPIRGALVRHDHVHLDLIVEGRKVPVPAGLGLAEPVDRGPCPPGPVFGDCAGGHVYTADVVPAPLHTHGSTGIVHIESDRPGAYALGQLFDVWGLRFTTRCLGAYCTRGGKSLRVFVNGRRVSGDPRRLVLRDRQEIAIVYGGPGAFGSVPSSFKGGWPGSGCGGSGERSCRPVGP